MISRLSLFQLLDKSARTEVVWIDSIKVVKYIDEYWTSKQRQASSIHEISYRACFKPALPKFFIELLTTPNDIVYDPFSGRGTTVIEAGLLARRVIANDVNPLSRILTQPRFFLPSLSDVSSRLDSIVIKDSLTSDLDLSMFFHPQTLIEILSIRDYLYEREAVGCLDYIDQWIAMVATNRLTGHSPGFFSVYTLPPNQACSPESQKRINERRRQKPEYRNVRRIILDKTKSLLRNLSSEQKQNLQLAGNTGLFLTLDAACTSVIQPNIVDLVVTSPPFLDVVQYAKDNWLRCWFNRLDINEISRRITMAKTVEGWSSYMRKVFVELFRVVRPGGWVAFEVGEVKNRTVSLDDYVVPIGVQAGFECYGVMVNSQEFTKTANIWGVKNMEGGTNTNRIVLFRKPEVVLS